MSAAEAQLVIKQEEPDDRVFLVDKTHPTVVDDAPNGGEATLPQNVEDEDPDVQIISVETVRGPVVAGEVVGAEVFCGPVVDGGVIDAEVVRHPDVEGREVVAAEGEVTEGGIVHGGEIGNTTPPSNAFRRLLAICCAAVTIPYEFIKAGRRYSIFVMVACLFLWAALAKVVCYATAGRGLLFAHARPICTVPLEPLGCLCAYPTVNTLAPIPDFGALMKIEGDSLQELLEQYKGITAVALDLSTMDIALPALIRIVNASDITGKEYFIARLLELQGASLNANEALERLGRRIYYCADSTVGINDFALRSIANDRPSLLERVLRTSTRDMRPVVRESFELAFEGFSTCVEGIAVLGKDAMFFLNAYQHQLELIHDVIVRETHVSLSIEDEVLGYIWTFLGGNVLKVRLIEDNLLVAGLFSNIHSSAAFYVNNTILTVTSINDQLSNLRFQAANVDKRQGAFALLPLRAHLNQIQMTMARVMVKMEHSDEDISQARKKVLKRAGVEE